MNEKINVDGNECIVLTTANIENDEYLYLAKIEDDDITGEFYVYQKDKNTNSYIKITDAAKLRKILLVVTANLME